ncbi:Gem-associated protein 2 [Orchesella cincta]|uniref:Gem-associated protein 2 n=1 Tax=Orchesella cincta TaxID=48709 RepID=A0A1D2MKA7_ORCCI|nr:Gem-associated protein 2 [Orchesella cincta]
MLDSDSDFEYSDGGGSGASSTEKDYGLLGKLALGVDPQDMKAYDGRSTPQNGSQYLMKVMSEKKVVPKVVCADVSKLALRNVRKDEGGAEVVKPSYLDRFLQRCNFNESGGDLNSRLLPSSKWREETVANFSLVRTRIERWRHKIESSGVGLDDSVVLPESNDNVVWLRFCFGQPFVKVAIGSKTKTEEQKLADFFLDLYDPSISKILEDLQLPVDNAKAGGDGNGNLDQSVSSATSDVEVEANTIDNAIISLDNSDQAAEVALVLGHRPLMSVVMKLNQGHLENLIKWHLLWVKNMGFVNECQGQWLYAVLASLHKPIEPSVMSDIRDIARKLINVRNSTSMWNATSVSEPETGENSSKDTANVDENVPNFINTLNLFVYIIADYFDQKDLIMKL